MQRVEPFSILVGLPRSTHRRARRALPSVRTGNVGQASVFVYFFFSATRRPDRQPASQPASFATPRSIHLARATASQHAPCASTHLSVGWTLSGFRSVSLPGQNKRQVAYLCNRQSIILHMAATIPVRSASHQDPLSAFNPSPIISACPLAFPAPLLPLWKPTRSRDAMCLCSLLLLQAANMLRNPNLTGAHLAAPKSATTVTRTPPPSRISRHWAAAAVASLTASGGGGPAVAHLRRDVRPKRGFGACPQAGA